MYEIYKKLLDEKNVKTSEVAKATGIHPSVFSDWKNGKSSPKSDKLQKIADFFNVSIDYLTTGKESNVFSDENSLVLAELVRNPELLESVKMLLKLKDNKKKHVIELINLLSE